MPAVEVKICGLTRPDAAAVCVAAGASYLGVIFASGPRVVTATVAGEVVHAAEGRPVLGVFGAQRVEEILRIRDAAGLSGAQLHGDQPVEVAARLRRAGLLVWRVARLAGPGELDGLPSFAEEADLVLVEPRVPALAGGAGVALDLDLGRAARIRLGACRMALAGGLRPENVAEAVLRVHPDVVDVSSGVERAPGWKDPGQVIRFMEAALGPFPPA